MCMSLVEAQNVAALEPLHQHSNRRADCFVSQFMCINRRVFAVYRYHVSVLMQAAQNIGILCYLAVD